MSISAIDCINFDTDLFSFSICHELFEKHILVRHKRTEQLHQQHKRARRWVGGSSVVNFYNSQAHAITRTKGLNGVSATPLPLHCGTVIPNANIIFYLREKSLRGNSMQIYVRWNKYREKISWCKKVTTYSTCFLFSTTTTTILANLQKTFDWQSNIK